MIAGVFIIGNVCRKLVLLIVSLIFLKDCLFACLCVCLFCYFGGGIFLPSTGYPSYVD